MVALPAWSADRPREVNVTSDSAKGWIPSPALEQEAYRTVRAFLAASDAGRASEAYGLLSDVNRRDESFEAFSERLVQFNTRAGPPRQRSITKATWTKDSARAPAPGIYVAFDLTSRFANVDRHCGYIVLHQPPGAGPFRVTRQDSVLMDNATARRVAAQQSLAEVEAAWKRASAACPNYQPDPVLAAVADPEAPIPEQPATGASGSVAETLAELRGRPGVVFTTENGWAVASEGSTMTLWSFAPQGHAAYPAVVRRQVVQDGAAVRLDMNVSCEASKAACDELVRAFVKLNEAMAQGLQRRR